MTLGAEEVGIDGVIQGDDGDLIVDQCFGLGEQGEAASRIGLDFGGVAEGIVLRVGPAGVVVAAVAHVLVGESRDVVVIADPTGAGDGVILVVQALAKDFDFHGFQFERDAEVLFHCRRMTCAMALLLLLSVLKRMERRGKFRPPGKPASARSCWAFATSNSRPFGEW